jgi:hypothetical protein
MSTATARASEFTKLPHFDPYQLDPADVLEPPTGLGNILKKIGPGIVLSASIVGSGELIATTTLGAEVGYTVMWLIIMSCLIKAVVQSFLGATPSRAARLASKPSTAFRACWAR